MATQSPPLKICLLGGTGFIGRHSAARLVARGHDVTVLTRARHRNRALLVLPTLRLVEGSPFDPDALARAMNGADAVINLVGVFNERGREGGFRHVHVELAEHALAAAAGAGVHRFIQLSALKARRDGPSAYLRTKGDAECRVQESSLAWTILQPSVVFGSGDAFSTRLTRLLRLLPVVPLTRPNARIAPVFVSDVAEAVVRVVETPDAVGRSYQLCGPRVYSLRELVALVGRIAGTPRPVLGLPETLAKLLAHAMEFFPGRPFSRDNYQTLSVHSICDSAAPGLRALGISPTGLETGLRRYMGSGDDD